MATPASVSAMPDELYRPEPLAEQRPGDQGRGRRHEEEQAGDRGSVASAQQEIEQRDRPRESTITSQSKGEDELGGPFDPPGLEQQRGHPQAAAAAANWIMLALRRS